MHSTTTGGNPLACAAGIAGHNVLLEEKLAESAAEIGDYVIRKLRELQKKYSDILFDIRKIGLLIYMIFCDDKKGYQVVTEMFNRGVLLSGAESNSRAIRIESPMRVNKEIVDAGLQKLDESLSVVSARTKVKASE